MAEVTEFKDFVRLPKVQTRKMNPVVIPEEAENAKGNHIYDPTRGADGMVHGYVPVTYENRDYPKMLFHPDFRKEPEPIANDFKESNQYEKAVRDWRKKYNRTQIAVNAKDEARLIKKGWLQTPPNGAVQQAASEQSEEI